LKAAALDLLHVTRPAPVALTTSSSAAAPGIGAVQGDVSTKILEAGEVLRKYGEEAAIEQGSV